MKYVADHISRTLAMDMGKISKNVPLHLRRPKKKAQLML